MTSLDQDKAENIICIPLASESSLADFMIIASGTSSRHVSGLTKKLKDILSTNNIKSVSLEGTAQCDWVVLDAGDIIVHIFRPEVREFYNIEKMWCSESTHTSSNDQIQA